MSTVRCSWCMTKGHNRRGCPTLKKSAATDPDSYAASIVREYASVTKKNKQVKCRFCNSTRLYPDYDKRIAAAMGHNQRGCKKRVEVKNNILVWLPQWRQLVFDSLAATGLGLGSVVETSSGYWTEAATTIGIVTDYKLPETPSHRANLTTQYSDGTIQSDVKPLPLVEYLDVLNISRTIGKGTSIILSQASIPLEFPTDWLDANYMQSIDEEYAQTVIDQIAIYD